MAGEATALACGCTAAGAAARGVRWGRAPRSGAVLREIGLDGFALRIIEHDGPAELTPVEMVYDLSDRDDGEHADPEVVAELAF